MGSFSTDPKFLSDGEISFEIRKIITSAEEGLTIVAPYVDPTDDVVREVEAARRRGVDVALRFRRDKLAEYVSTKCFRAFDEAGVVLGTVDRLHSKLYVNESVALVTSMNFTRSSGENSFETGALFESDAIFDKVLDYLEKLELSVEPASAGQVSRTRRAARGPARKPAATGFCIRCHTSIPLDPKHPYCDTHYTSWARYKDENYEDKNCHACGKPHPATMRKPVCRECFAKAA